MLKRTMLDMGGVFSSASELVEKAAAVRADPLVSDAVAQQLLQDEPVGVASHLPDAVDINSVSAETDLQPQEVEQIMTGAAPASGISAKSLADSVLFDLSDADRDMLEKINGQ